MCVCVHAAGGYHEWTGYVISTVFSPSILTISDQCTEYSPQVYCIHVILPGLTANK